ncbi:hypothetical protein V6N11_067185 [Hibiscus sabdariffa]|uniref:Uncharacterized protein n=1 Tax=Hibiscus sabdariffa TaxID=183260 RepID=A0ABR2SQB7_9ROSI
MMCTKSSSLMILEFVHDHASIPCGSIDSGAGLSLAIFPSSLCSAPLRSAGGSLP